MTRARCRRYLIVGLGCAAALWLAGLILFVDHIRDLREPPIDATLQQTDAIIVLTGGSERVTTGLELLRTGKARKLFISGVHPGLTLDPLIGNLLIPPGMRECCIALGHAAESTRGNADESLIWMTMQNYHSLRLVTANYHMPRSLLVFHAAMPDMAIVPHPVSPDSVKLNRWWLRPGTASLLVTEYNKYLWVRARLLVGS